MANVNETCLLLNVQVDTDGHKLSSDVSHPELVKVVWLVQRQPLGELHGSQGEDQVGDLEK